MADTMTGGLAVTASIASAATKSQAIGLSNKRLLGFQMPAAFTGTALTFEVSSDNETFVPLYDDQNAAVSVTVAVSRGYSIDPSLFAGWEFLKVVSGSSEGAARSIILLTGRVLG